MGEKQSQSALLAQFYEVVMVRDYFTLNFSERQDISL